MISYILNGYSHQHHVQTMIQIFYPNIPYVLLEQVPPIGICVVSAISSDSVHAFFFLNGQEQKKISLPYQTNTTPKELKHLIKVSLFLLLQAQTNFTPQWGLLSGIRPVKLLHSLLQNHPSEIEALKEFQEHYFVSKEKSSLALEVARTETKVLKQSPKNGISIYISIPFCPSRCVYCSFPSHLLAQYHDQVDDYLNALLKELRFVAEKTKNYIVQTIYIGGGTPTSLTEAQLEFLLQHIQNLFPLANCEEYTLEAGRPDTITQKKLQLMKQYHINRISINPQSMNLNTLKAIGRNHTPKDIETIFYMAREIGHDMINMDIILGLSDETPNHIHHTMTELQKLNPENITVHTLAIKRASHLNETQSTQALQSMHQTAISNMEEMLAITQAFAKEMHLSPYYLYRQKNSLGHFENVGYCKEGTESIYNIQMIEEKQIILGIGAGATSKIPKQNHTPLQTIYNIKGIEEYILRIDEMIVRKKTLLDSLS